MAHVTQEEFWAFQARLVEDEFYSAIESRDARLAERNKQIAERNKQIAERNKKIAARDECIRAAVRELRNRGFDDDAIAQTMKLPIEEVRAL